MTPSSPPPIIARPQRPSVQGAFTFAAPAQSIYIEVRIPEQDAADIAIVEARRAEPFSPLEETLARLGD